VVRNNNLLPRGTRLSTSVTLRIATDPHIDATLIVDALHTDTLRYGGATCLCIINGQQPRK